jgi:hypothetical protein
MIVGWNILIREHRGKVYCSNNSKADSLAQRIKANCTLNVKRLIDHSRVSVLFKEHGGKLYG